MIATKSSRTHHVQSGVAVMLLLIVIWQMYPILDAMVSQTLLNVRTPMIKNVGPYRVLVTGGGGFIGMHTSLRLQANGHHVVAYDNLNSYYNPALKQSRIQKLHANDIPFVRADVCNATAMEAVIKEHRISHIVHLAAQAGVRYSIDHPHEYVRNNVDCFVTLLEAIKALNVRLVYASSSSVYGKNDKIPFTETDPVERPASLYAATKRSNELIAHVYHDLYKQQSIGLRFFTVYGPWGRPDMAYWSFTKSILEQTPIRMFNHGNLERDFTYIDDVVDGIVASLDVLSYTPLILNLGSHRPVHLKRFIEIIEASVGQRAIIESVKMQSGDVPRTYADLAQSRRVLNYNPTTPLEVGIPRFVEWYLEHHDFDRSFKALIKSPLALTIPLVA